MRMAGLLLGVHVRPCHNGSLDCERRHGALLHLGVRMLGVKSVASA